MTTSPCPSEERLWRYLDQDLSPRDASAVSQHVTECGRCRDEQERLHALLASLRAPELPSADRAAHVEAVLNRIATDPQPQAAHRLRKLLGLLLPLAAAGALLIAQLGQDGRFQARGGPSEVTIGRDVGVQPYAVDPSLHALVAGSVIRSDAPLTASFRNLGPGPVYLLLFAVDARGALHWISPRYERAGEDPAATALASSRSERLLPDTVVFEDLATGPLRIVSVITPEVAHVSDLEAIGGGASAAAISQRLPRAEVRELRLLVANEAKERP